MAVAYNVVNGISGRPWWSDKTIGEILVDINNGLIRAWENSDWNTIPNRLTIPPSSMCHLCVRWMTDEHGRRISFFDHINRYNLIRGLGDGELTITHDKHLSRAGVGGIGRMIASNPSDLLCISLSDGIEIPSDLRD